MYFKGREGRGEKDLGVLREGERSYGKVIFSAKGRRYVN